MGGVEKLFMIKLSKIFNYVACLLLALSVVLRILDFGKSTNPFFYLLTFYLVGFGALLIISELRIKKIITLVMFLNSRFGKGIYLVFIGLILFDEDRKSDMAISIITVLIGFFNIMISCMRKGAGREEET